MPDMNISPKLLLRDRTLYSALEATVLSVGYQNMKAEGINGHSCLLKIEGYSNCLGFRELRVISFVNIGTVLQTIKLLKLFYVAFTTLATLSLLILEVPRSQKDASHSVGLLWASDETSS
jgi:uncharacterized membrane protein YkgB